MRVYSTALAVPLYKQKCVVLFRGNVTSMRDAEIKLHGGIALHMTSSIQSISLSGNPQHHLW